ncbi:hypothetical protein ACFO0F_56000, partial [Nonomuraea zeae]
MPERYGLLVLLGAGVGLRQGEALGLALDRVHSDEGMITINQQVIVINRRPQLGPPKTSASLRDVLMPMFVAAAINEQVERFDLTADAVLCRTGRGSLLRRDYFNKKIWKPALVAAKLPGDVTLLSRPGARCRDCSQSVSPGRSPNPPCRSLGNGLST